MELDLIGKLGPRPLREFTDGEAELQRFVNTYVESGASSSLLSKITVHLRAISISRSIAGCLVATRRVI